MTDTQAAASTANRIAGYDPAVDPSELLAHPLNARVHPEAQREALGERGEALREVIEHPRCPAGVRAVGLEVSQPMLAAARARFEDNRQVEICEWDLRQGVPFMYGNAGVVLGVLTVMFTPMQWRPHLLADVRKVLRPGGAFLFVEKVLGQTAEVDRLITDAYHDLKAANGYTREQIDRKALALEGVQVPVTAAWNEDLLRSAGFTSVDCIWRWGPFAGWLAQ